MPIHTYTHTHTSVGSALRPQTRPFIYMNFCHPLRSILEFSNDLQLLYLKLSQLSCWGTAGNKQEKMGKGLKLHQGSWGWILGKAFFAEGVVKNWNRLLRGVVETPSLEVLKKISPCLTSWHDLVGMVVLGQRLDLMICFFSALIFYHSTNIKPVS